MARKIEVVDYDPQWEKEFKSEAKKIRAILGKNCVAIHHIGSTAVRGLRAKPVIDIMPVVKDLSLVDGLDPEFQALGYECMGENGIPGRRFYQKGGDNRTHHVHIYAAGNQAEINRHLAVRDYLQSHSDAAKEYAALKTDLARRFPDDSEAYCTGKDPFLKDLEHKALEWQSQENHLGMCMAIGMCFGTAIGASCGAAFGNTGLGMCFGISIGMCLGLAFGSAKKKQ